VPHHRVNTPSVISESIDGEVVIIALATGTYYSLRGTAARAWDGLAAGWSTDDVTADLRSTFDAEGAPVADDLGAFVAALLAEGLIATSEEAPAEPPSPLPPPATIAPWEPLVLETFTDMQELILLDPVHEVAPAQGWPVAIDPDPPI
jgi:Coenzyme PQQ synthesis protein D (PqqD)